MKPAKNKRLIAKKWVDTRKCLYPRLATIIMELAPRQWIPASNVITEEMVPAGTTRAACIKTFYRNAWDFDLGVSNISIFNVVNRYEEDSTGRLVYFLRHQYGQKQRFLYVEYIDSSLSRQNIDEELVRGWLNSVIVKRTPCDMNDDIMNRIVQRFQGEWSKCDLISKTKVEASDTSLILSNEKESQPEAVVLDTCEELLEKLQDDSIEIDNKDTFSK